MVQRCIDVIITVIDWRLISFVSHIYSMTCVAVQNLDVLLLQDLVLIRWLALNVVNTFKLAESRLRNLHLPRAKFIGIHSNLSPQITLPLHV